MGGKLGGKWGDMSGRCKFHSCQIQAFSFGQRLMAVLSFSLVREVAVVQLWPVFGGFEGRSGRNQGSGELEGICVPSGVSRALKGCMLCPDIVHHKIRP